MKEGDNMIGTIIYGVALGFGIIVGKFLIPESIGMGFRMIFGSSAGVAMDLILKGMFNRE